MKNDIVEIAFLRNHLYLSIFTEQDEMLLEQIKETLLSSDTPFKEISMLCITNCENDISIGDFKSASREINLIHNFRFVDANTWNSNYFYTVEFASYLEKSENPERIKKLICELAELQKKLNN